MPKLESTSSIDTYWRWLLVAFFSTSAVFFGELFEQVVFVPNWLIGDIPKNVEHFRNFSHAVNPGLYYFPCALLSIISHSVLLRAKTLFSKAEKKAIRASFISFLLVLCVTAYVILAINVPVLDNASVPKQEIASKLTLWAALNTIRIILPGYALYKLSSLMTFTNFNETTSN